MKKKASKFKEAHKILIFFARGRILLHLKKSAFKAKVYFRE